MHSVQRHFGKYMKRSADEQQVSVLLKDFEEADKLLTKIIEASKAWRESWTSILTHQHRVFDEFSILYAPIVGASDDYHGHVAVQTPDHIVRRTARIKGEYEDLKRDLTEDLAQVEERLIRPAQNAKDSLQTMKKTIKKREDRKLDFERYQNRVDSQQKKTKRSERDNAALVKSQSELEAAIEAYHAADDNLRGCLPRLLTSVFSLLPHFLAAQIQIQNNLLGHYYTMLHTYCTEEGFPSPAPPMDEVIRLWNDAFKPVQRDAESLAILANGKAARTSMENGNPPVNGYRRPSASAFSAHRQQSVSPARALPPSPSFEPKTKLSSSPAASSVLSASTPQEFIASPSPSQSVYQTPMAYSPAGPNTDYFSRDRQPSGVSAVSAAAAAASIAQKKRPPPPPPPRLPSQQTIFVTALYDFDGQSEGDLAFREGDRIRVIKKTESTDDWWQGELRGMKGPFPANYCQ
ncbi:BAR domain-containing protein [Cladophialophora immunda]|nr:BAR domain-containing protein [Cladophialophora immunda]